ncbi:MAG TPA: transglutaminase-like domain-containing protein [Thermoanaerobaculia bacterium]|nr:transglutaminase-like domain-containing protein [Thermoanaerobaculia bacterium]
MRGPSWIVAIGLALAASGAAGEELAIYRAGGEDVRLFDQYDNDGYSLSVSPRPDGSTELRVRVSDSPLASDAPFPTSFPPEVSLPAAPDRDAFARRLTAGSRTEADAVRRLLLGIAARVRYDPDRLRRQDPAAVFASRRAYCVGLAELAVDLLRRVRIPARTVQGILRAEPGSEAYDLSVGGAYHRWVEVYYPDRGYVFSDPCTSVNGVDARYIPFVRRTLSRPRALRLEPVWASGGLSYQSVRAGDTTVRVRATESFGGRR